MKKMGVETATPIRRSAASLDPVRRTHALVGAAVCIAGVVLILFANWAVTAAFNAAQLPALNLQTRYAEAATHVQAVRARKYERLIGRVETVDRALHRAEVRAPSAEIVRRIHAVEDTLEDDDERLRTGLARTERKLDVDRRWTERLHKKAFERGVR